MMTANRLFTILILGLVAIGSVMLYVRFLALGSVVLCEVSRECLLKAFYILTTINASELKKKGQGNVTNTKRI